MSATQSESKLDDIIRRFLEKYDKLDKPQNNKTKYSVASVFAVLQENGLFPGFVEKEPKSDEESGKFRDVGNTAYRAKELKEALKNYTKAVCSAKVGSEAMALAHANRSAVHYELQQHNDVIRDVCHALGTGRYPKDLQHKLYERRAKSYMALSQFQKALKDLTTVICCITNSNEDHEKIMNELINGNTSAITNTEDSKMDREKVQHLKSLAELIAHCTGQPNLPLPKPTNPKLSHKPSKNGFPALEIAASPAMGKHVVAATNISPGDLLAMEKPYIAVLTPEFFQSFCDNCKVKCHSSLACENCNNVVYCSEDCRRKSWELYHAIECDLLPSMMDLGCKVNVLIGIRGLLKATRCGKDLAKFIEEHTSQTKGLKTNGKSPKTGQSSDFHRVHNLVTHEEDRSQVQILSVAVTVSCIVHILNNTKLFTARVHSSDQIIAANLIARYFMMAGCNAFEIGESRLVDYGNFVDYRFRITGGALYPTFCLINHSCDPNAAAYMSDEETRVLYAIKPIRKGDQIFISYGPEYIHHDLSTRQNELKSKYFFICRCPACENDWPLAHNLPEYPTFISHKVESASAPRIFETCNKLPEIVQAADKGLMTQEQFQSAIQYLSLYHKYVVRPWKYYFAAQRVIRQYFNYKGHHKITQAL